MIYIYINYPNPIFRVHNPICAFINYDTAVRKFEFSGDLANQLSIFLEKNFQFAAQAGMNDLWLKIDLGNDHLNISLVEVIKKILGDRYIPLANANISNCTRCNRLKRSGTCSLL